jgi:tetratricopeptide (TPR) repeat protein
MEKDSTWAFGFIYLDNQAGLTLHYEGKISISADGRFTASRPEGGLFKWLSRNDRKVGLLPPDKFAELEVNEFPDWLSIYNGDTASARRIFKLGYIHNAWRQCAKGLAYLSRVQQIDPKFEGLPAEMAFSYNCLGQHDKAIALIEGALEETKENAYLAKELVYAYMQSGNTLKAAETWKKYIDKLTDTTYHAENTYNLLYSFFLEKDKKNFNEWLDPAKKWCKGKEELMSSIGLMEKKIND